MTAGNQLRPIPGLDLSSPELHVVPRLEKASELGISSSSIGYAVNALVDGAFAGDYWHEGDMGQEDRFKFIQVEQDLKGSTNPLVIFWQKDVSSQEDADRVILQRLGTG